MMIREDRIIATEFLTQNNILVVGLREGSWLRINDNKITLMGSLSARIFEQHNASYEISSGSNIAF